MEARVAACGSEVGVEWRWIPVSSFARTGRWERNDSEAKDVRIRELLYDDDTTVVGMKKEIDGGVNAMKEVMGKFDERSNDKGKVSGFLYGRESEYKSAWVMGGYERGCEYEVEKSGRFMGESEGAAEEHEVVKEVARQGFCKHVRKVHVCLIAEQK